MGGTNAQLPIGQQVSLPGHFDLPVTLESARPLAKGIECRVRLPDGTRAEAEAQAEAELAGGLKLLALKRQRAGQKPAESPAVAEDYDRPGQAAAELKRGDGRSARKGLLPISGQEQFLL